ncbi:MAG: CvpA family protein [Muribaculaceae bacterium]|nr:CvpA family protein [Muribaculaceae bacterium]
MSTLDIIILAVLIGSAAYGFIKGIVVQVGAIAAVVFGILADRLFGDAATRFVGRLLGNLSDSPALSHYITTIIAYVALFALVYLLTRAMTHFVKTMVRSLFMGTLDRFLGALFSVFQWMLILSILLNVWQIADSSKNIVAMSNLGHGQVARAILDFAPAIFGIDKFPNLF